MSNTCIIQDVRRIAMEKYRLEELQIGSDMVRRASRRCPSCFVLVDSPGLEPGRLCDYEFTARCVTIPPRIR